MRLARRVVPAHKLRIKGCSRLRGMISGQAPEAAAAQGDDVSYLLTDAHCHPQLDPGRLDAVSSLSARRIAVMSVAYDVDWELTAALGAAAGAGGANTLLSLFALEQLFFAVSRRLTHAHQTDKIIFSRTYQVARLCQDLASTHGGRTCMPHHWVILQQRCCPRLTTASSQPRLLLCQLETQLLTQERTRSIDPGQWRATPTAPLLAAAGREAPTLQQCTAAAAAAWAQACASCHKKSGKIDCGRFLLQSRPLLLVVRWQGMLCCASC
jgi:hypothetical protein